jgi:hypothetical protein
LSIAVFLSAISVFIAAFLSATSWSISLPKSSILLSIAPNLVFNPASSISTLETAPA